MQDYGVHGTVLFCLHSFDIIYIYSICHHRVNLKRRAARHLSSHMADLIACRENENIMKPLQNRCQKKQN